MSGNNWLVILKQQLLAAPQNCIMFYWQVSLQRGAAGCAGGQSSENMCKAGKTRQKRCRLIKNNEQQPWAAWVIPLAYCPSISHLSYWYHEPHQNFTEISLHTTKSFLPGSTMVTNLCLNIVTMWLVLFSFVPLTWWDWWHMKAMGQTKVSIAVLNSHTCTQC